VSPTPLPDLGCLFEAAPDAYLVLAVDAPRFTVAAATDAYLHIATAQREQIVGRSLFEAFPDSLGDPHATAVGSLRSSLDRVLRERAPHAMPPQKYGIRRRDGSFAERFWRTLNSPVFDGQRRVTHKYAARILFPDGTPVPPDQLVSSRVLRTGEPVIGAEFLIERAGGSRIPILGSAAALRGADGSVIGAVGVFQDISERMRAEEAIRSRERLLSSIFELLPVGLWIADEQGRCVRMNPAAIRIWGRHHAGVTDYQSASAWWADTGEPVSAHEWPLVRALQGEHVLDKVIRIQTADAAEKTIASSALPLVDGDGRVIGACVVKHDISDLKRAEERLRQAIRSRDEVLGIVAHVRCRASHMRSDGKGVPLR
jgi:PAS domain S-box-containing protein